MLGALKKFLRLTFDVISLGRRIEDETIVEYSLVEYSHRSVSEEMK